MLVTAQSWRRGVAGVVFGGVARQEPEGRRELVGVIGFGEIDNLFVRVQRIEHSILRYSAHTLVAHSFTWSGRRGPCKTPPATLVTPHGAYSTSLRPVHVQNRSQGAA